MAPAPTTGEMCGSGSGCLCLQLCLHTHGIDDVLLEFVKISPDLLLLSKCSPRRRS